MSKTVLIVGSTVASSVVPKEPIHVRVFLDRSIIEVFVNERQCLTQRIYPTRQDSLGIAVFARDGEIHVNSLEAWDMLPVR